MALTRDSISGIWPAYPTAVTKAGDIDAPALERLIAHGLAGGASGLVPIGGTGEYTALSPSARTKVVETSVAAAGGRVPVVPGILSPGYAEALAAGRDFAAAGASALMLLTPYYVTPSQAGIRDYFKRYRDAVDLPLLLYDIPYRTRIVVDPDTIAAMAEDGSIIGMKACNTDFTHFSKVAALVGERIAILSGEDFLFPAHVTLGAVGGVIATASLIPRPFVDILSLVQSGRTAEALAIHRRLFAFLDAIFAETNPGVLKPALAAVGLSVGDVLPPLQPAQPATLRRMHEALDGLREAGLLTASERRAAAE